MRSGRLELTRSRLRPHLSICAELLPDQKRPVGLEVIESLCCGIYLIVTFAAREGRQLAFIGFEPRSRTWDQHTAALKLRSLSMKTQNFVCSRGSFICADAEQPFESQILNQLRTGCLIFD